MKGAMGELWVKKISAPSKRKTATNGINHQILFCQRNENRSFMIEPLDKIILKNFIILKRLFP